MIADTHEDRRVVTARWRRAYRLRRTFTESILQAGMRKTYTGEEEPWVALPDSLDDAIYRELKRESETTEQRWRNRARNSSINRRT